MYYIHKNTLSLYIMPTPDLLNKNADFLIS
jgi:hypothetical protein